MSKQQAGGSIAFSAILTAISVPATVQQAVVGTNLINVANPAGSTLQKNSGCDGCQDASAVSQQQIASGNGYMEFTIGGTCKRFEVGLANSLSMPPTIDQPNFAFGMWPECGLEVRKLVSDASATASPA